MENVGSYSWVFTVLLLLLLLLLFITVEFSLRGHPRGTSK